MLLKKKSGELAQGIKLSVDKPVYLSSVPGPHKVEGKKTQLLQVIVFCESICISMHLQLVNKNI